MVDWTDSERFRELLDSQYTWPTLYTFKFIVPHDKTSELEAMLPRGSFTTRPSAKGNYIAYSATLNVGSAESVIALYEQAAAIEGILSL